MLSFIVLSSDGYSDCWDPFFELFEKRFPNIHNLEIILSTNTKEYSYSNLNIKTIAHGENLPWSKRLRLSLEMAKNEIVLPLSEDFFLISKVDEIAFTKVLDSIIIEDEIDHIRLLNVGNDLEESKFELLDKITPNSKKRFLFSPGLWKKEILKKYINDNENPWLAERMGNFRSKIYQDGFYCISQDYVNSSGQLYDTYFSGVIYKGKCTHNTAPFLKNEGFNEILKRGILTKAEAKEVKKKAKTDLIFDVVPMIKSLSNIVYLYFKEKIKLIFK